MHPTYLPFPAEVVRQHFLAPDAEGKDLERHLAHFRRGIENSTNAALPNARRYQIQKDERFWTVAALLAVEEAGAFPALLDSCVAPPAGYSWLEALGPEPELFFEVSLPSPAGYGPWLRERLVERAPIPYVRDSAGAALEGPTHVDALLLGIDGVAVLFEAKVLSDVSAHVTFDVVRNQLARNVDVMLESHVAKALDPRLQKRRPGMSYLVLLTPALFKRCPSGRLYGRLMPEYLGSAAALARDLPHREADWDAVRGRLGWLTWEDIQKAVPKACGWLPPPSA